MKFQVKQRKSEDVAVLDLSGRIVLGEETSRLEETLKALIAGGEKKILLNLAEVTYIDSVGLGVLARSQMTALAQNGQIKLLHVPAKVETLLKITKLQGPQGPLERFDDEGKAVESFGP
jgi:anti-sigma B factor antagonist